MEEYLDEVLILYQRSEEYNQYVLAVMADAVSPKALGTAHEAAFRSGAFHVAVRELVTYCINLARSLGAIAGKNRRLGPSGCLPPGASQQAA